MAVLALGAVLAIGIAGHQSAAAPAAKISLTSASTGSAAPDLAVVSKAALSPPVAGHQAVPRRLRAFRWAVQNAKGCQYRWAKTGPCSYGFDCSGLVFAAYTHIGVKGMPRDTYEMLASSKLHQVFGRAIRRGMLAFFGSGHVELVAYAHDGQVRYTLGAREPGTVVSFWKITGGFAPTAVYAVRLPAL